MPRLSEPEPLDADSFRRLLKGLYEGYCESQARAGRSAISKARISLVCGMQDRGWFNKVLGGAPGCQNLRTATLVRLADALELSTTDRRRLARAANRPYAPFAPAVVARPLEAISMRRALLLMSGPHVAEAAAAVGAVASAMPSVSVRLSRVFGAHDMILRATAPPGRLVVPDVVDRVRGAVGSVTTDTLLVRDDVLFVAHPRATDEPKTSRRRRLAYVFIEHAGSVGHDELIGSMMREARPQGIDLLTAATLIGRFDAVAEVLVEQLDHLDTYVQNLRRSLPVPSATITYPTVQVLVDQAVTPW